MNNEPKDTYAFPHKCQHLVYKGMTLRDYFAAKAMQSMITGVIGAGVTITDHEIGAIASHAYIQADAMLAAVQEQNQ